MPVPGPSRLDLSRGPPAWTRGCTSLRQKSRSVYGNQSLLCKPISAARELEFCDPLPRGSLLLCRRGRVSGWLPLPELHRTHRPGCQPINLGLRSRLNLRAHNRTSPIFRHRPVKIPFPGRYSSVGLMVGGVPRNPVPLPHPHAFIMSL